MLRQRAAMYLAVAAIAGWTAVLNAPAATVPAGANRTPPTRTDSQQLAERIDALKKEVARLEVRVAELTRDNRDLTARLEARREQGPTTPAPAVEGEPAVLSTINDERATGRQVLVWDTPGGPMTGAKVVGRVRSGLPVRAIKTQRVGTQEWTQCYTYHFTPNSIGWVVSHMVHSKPPKSVVQDEG